MKKNVLLMIVAFCSLILLSSDTFAAGGPKVKLREYQGEKPSNRPMLQKWAGDYPVAELERLPAGQRQASVGYIGDAETFASVWQVLKPGTALPQVDFDKNLVVFVRNLKFYYHTLVEKVTFKEGVAEIIAAEPLTPVQPVEDRVAMGMAVISRAGLKFIHSDNEQIPVR